MKIIITDESGELRAKFELRSENNGVIKKAEYDVCLSMTPIPNMSINADKLALLLEKALIDYALDSLKTP